MRLVKSRSPWMVCFRLTSSSERNARLSQQKTREPAQKPSGNDLSTLLRMPTARLTPSATGLARSRVPKNRDPSLMTPSCCLTIA